jgi:hypothetical protein
MFALTTLINIVYRTVSNLQCCDVDADNMMKETAGSSSEPCDADMWNKNLPPAVKFAGDDETDAFGFEEVISVTPCNCRRNYSHHCDVIYRNFPETSYRQTALFTCLSDQFYFNLPNSASFWTITTNTVQKSRFRTISRTLLHPQLHLWDCESHRSCVTREIGDDCNIFYPVTGSALESRCSMSAVVVRDTAFHFRGTRKLIEKKWRVQVPCRIDSLCFQAKIRLYKLSENSAAKMPWNYNDFETLLFSYRSVAEAENI